MYKTKKVFHITVVLIMSLLLILSACAPTSEGESGSIETVTEQPTSSDEETASLIEQDSSDEESTLIFANLGDPSTIDPAKVSGGSARIYIQSYEPLLRYKDSSGELIPWLATEWQMNEDCQSITLELRDDVKFHDGVNFNAEAAKFSLDRFITIGQSTAWAFKRVMDEESIKVVDEYTLQIDLTRSYCDFPKLLAMGVGIGMISPGIMEHEVDGDLGQEWASQNIVGTGPYILVDWKPNEEMVFDKFPDYWGGWEGQHIDRLIVKAVPERSTRRMMVENGEAHFSVYPDDEDLALIEASPATKAFVFTPGESPYTFAFLFNTQNGPLSDIKLREALSWAFPYEEFIKNAALGLGNQSVGPIPVVLENHNPDVFVYHQDLEKARQLLTEAGYPNGKGLKLKLYFSVGDDKIAQVMLSACEEIGIEVEAQVQNWSAMLDAMSNPTSAPDIALGSGFMDYPAVESFLRNYATTYWWRGDGVDSYYYYNEEFAKLLDAVPFEVDADKKQEMDYRMQEILVDDIAGIWVYNKDQFWIMTADVMGTTYNPWYYNTPYFYEMYIE